MMRIELVKRPQRSALFSMLSPFIAFALTLIAGAIMFAMLGVNPAKALYAYFISPLTEVWQLHELAIKAAPLIMIAVGLSVCFRANIWNIGAEGQFTIGAIAGSLLPVLYPDLQGAYLLPLMLLMGMIGGAAYASVPALLKARFNTNEILTSLMLVYVSQLFLDWVVRGPWRDPMGYNFPQTVQFSSAARLPELLDFRARQSGLHLLHRRGGTGLADDEPHAQGFRGPRSRVEPEGRALRRFQHQTHGVLRLHAVGGSGRSCRHFGSLRRDRPAPARHFARLRLCRDHRRVPRPAQSTRHHRGRAGAGPDLSGG